MSIWSMDQIGEVSQLRRTFTVDPAVSGAEKMVTNVRIQCARDLTKKGLDLGVVLHPEDMEFTIVDEYVGGRRLVKVIAGWRPTTQEVQLQGGHAKDGLVFTYSSAPHRALITADGPADPLLDEDTPVTVHQDVWSCVGWSETHRRWIYGLSESRSTMEAREPEETT